MSGCHKVASWRFAGSRLSHLRYDGSALFPYPSSLLAICWVALSPTFATALVLIPVRPSQQDGDLYERAPRAFARHLFQPLHDGSACVSQLVCTTLAMRNSWWYLTVSLFRQLHYRSCHRPSRKLSTWSPVAANPHVLCRLWQSVQNPHRISSAHRQSHS
eukprot:COSAG03_NODE_114_length_12445_cov_68.628382_6_plen_160_part_00